MKMSGLARLGRNAELRRTPDGTAVCNLSLAVMYGVKNGNGERPTQWIEAALWGKQAESVSQYLLKGTVHCFYLSDIHMEKFQGQNGEGHKLVARVDDIDLGPRQGDNAAAPASAPAAGRSAAPAAPARRPAASPAPAPGGFADMDDDIPF